MCDRQRTQRIYMSICRHNSGNRVFNNMRRILELSKYITYMHYIAFMPSMSHVTMQSCSSLITKLHSAVHVY